MSLNLITIFNWKKISTMVKKFIKHRIYHKTNLFNINTKILYKDLGQVSYSLPFSSEFEAKLILIAIFVVQNLLWKVKTSTKKHQWITERLILLTSRNVTMIKDGSMLGLSHFLFIMEKFFFLSNEFCNYFWYNLVYVISLFESEFGLKIGFSSEKLLKVVIIW